MQPADVVALIQLKYPLGYANVDKIRATKERVRNWIPYENLVLADGEEIWPDEVFIPSEVAVLAIQDIVNRDLTETEKTHPMVLAGLAAWRQSKNTYTTGKIFDDSFPDLDLAKVSPRVLLDLPASSIVMNISNKCPFFAFLDFDIRIRIWKLCILLIPETSNEGIGLLPMPILGDSIDDMLTRLKSDEPSAPAEIAYLLAHIVHLCSFKVNHRNEEGSGYFVTQSGLVKQN